jgi:hypothetical protein
MHHRKKSDNESDFGLGVVLRWFEGADSVSLQGFRVYGEDGGRLTF